VQQIQSSKDALAAILLDGSVITWGDPKGGGDSSEVQSDLRNVGDPQAGGETQRCSRNVQQVQANTSAFVAILPSGYAVTWGHPSCGGTA